VMKPRSELLGRCGLAERGAWETVTSREELD
jgi:hypothetical protein